MSENEIKMVLDVLSRAIARETAAFNYYFKQSRDTSFPKGVRGLLTKLSEEERKHRNLILNEYIAVQKGWGEDAPEKSRDPGVSYVIPERPPFVPLDAPAGLDVKAVSLPARLLGGDSVISVVTTELSGEGTGVFLTLYDAMGHSLSTTGVNAMAAAVLGEYIDATSSAEAEKEKLSPRRAVRHLNREFSEEYEGEGVFITLFSAYIDLREGVVKYTIAGHEPPVLVRKNGKLESLLFTQLLLGIDPDYNYREYEIEFGEGDLLCAFSDGLIEAGDGKGGYYGRDRLSAVLKETRGLSSEDVIKRILDDVGEFTSGADLTDEISILVARRGSSE